MRVVLLLLLAGGAVVLISQNWSPVLPLVLFGRETLSLPIAVWLSLGVVAGALTSVTIQLLHYRPSQSARRVTPAPRVEADRDYRRPLTPREIRRQRDRNWEPRPGADWETPPPPDDDWNIEEAPPEPTVVQGPRPESKRDRPAPADRSERAPKPTAPIPQDTRPEASSTSAAVGRDNDRVYDAKYRIIMPPPTSAEDRPEATAPPNEADDSESDWV